MSSLEAFEGVGRGVVRVLRWNRALFGFEPVSLLRRPLRVGAFCAQSGALGVRASLHSQVILRMALRVDAFAPRMGALRLCFFWEYWETRGG